MFLIISLFKQFMCICSFQTNRSSMFVVYSLISRLRIEHYNIIFTSLGLWLVVILKIEWRERWMNQTTQTITLFMRFSVFLNSKKIKFHSETFMCRKLKHLEWIMISIFLSKFVVAILKTYRNYRDDNLLQPVSFFTDIQT